MVARRKVIRIFYIICVSCLSVILSCLFFAALWPPAGKGLSSWLSCVRCFLGVFVTFPCGVPGQVWYLIVLIPDLILLPYLYSDLRYESSFLKETE